MKFKVKEKPHVRFVRRFAIIPVRLGREIIWLESYYAMQKQESRYGGYITIGYYSKDVYKKLGPDEIIRERFL